MADSITADFLILADAAQVQGEKLYLLGGGWSLIWVQQFPAQHQMAVAAGILVPWMETNARHRFRIRVVTEDGASLIRVTGEDGTVSGEINGEFEQGRAAGLPAGTTQRVMVAVNLSIRLERPLEAAAELWLDDTLARSVPFRAVLRTRR